MTAEIGNSVDQDPRNLRKRNTEIRIEVEEAEVRVNIRDAEADRMNGISARKEIGPMKGKNNIGGKNADTASHRKVLLSRIERSTKLNRETPVEIAIPAVWYHPANKVTDLSK